MQMAHIIEEVSKIILFMDVARLFIGRMGLSILEIGWMISQMERVLSIISKGVDTKEN